MSKSTGSDYWLMLFYFGMAAVTAFSGFYVGDFSWLLLAVGSGCLGVSRQVVYVASQSAADEEQSGKSGVFSRIGFLFIAAGLLLNVFGSGSGG